MPHRWSSHHRRLHRHLLQRPGLLPAGAPLLLAVSGGQDSMALTALLADLRHLHGWSLQLWHGDHGWRPESAMQAAGLAAWAAAEALPLHQERADPPPAGEAEARRWRYSCLERCAAALGCRHVVSGHTGSDRAETVLLNLARGCHLEGLCSLRAQRSLAGGAVLVRPLLPFSRGDTAHICRELTLPVWIDASNDEDRYARNRVRAEVLPVLEALHPGADRRIAAGAERLEQEVDAQQELLSLALESLRHGDGKAPAALQRRQLGSLVPANRRRLLRRWLERQGAAAPVGDALETLVRRLQPERGPGQQDLAGGWRLRWDRSTLTLERPGDPADGDG